MKKTGFTLIELIVVIAIIAILAAIIAPNAFRAIEKAKISASIEDHRSIKTATMAYYADTALWPLDGIGTVEPPINGLLRNDNRGAGATPTPGWDGSYLEKWPSVAKWGGAYTFQNDSVIDWDNADGDDDITTGGDEARYVEISNVPQAAAERIDREADGAQNNATGSIRYVAVYPTTIRALISTGVAVN